MVKCLFSKEGRILFTPYEFTHSEEYLKESTKLPIVLKSFHSAQIIIPNTYFKHLIKNDEEENTVPFFVLTGTGKNSEEK